MAKKRKTAKPRAAKKPARKTSARPAVVRSASSTARALEEANAQITNTVGSKGGGWISGTNADQTVGIEVAGVPDGEHRAGKRTLVVRDGRVIEARG